MSAIEDKIDGLNALRKRAHEIESAMRDFRLGAKVETADDRPLLRRIQWKGMVFGGGWTGRVTEPFPEAVTQDFYDFLREREKAIWVDIHRIEKELEGIES